MHNSNVLQLSGYDLPEVHPSAFEAFQCTPGKVVVEMSSAIGKIGSIFIPSKVGGKLRCDVGIVLSCNPPRDKKGDPMPMDIKPGDAVLVRPYDGAWYDGFDTGTYSTENQVRFYGIVGIASLNEVTKGQDGDKSDRGTYEKVPWNQSIVAKLVGNVVVPTHGNVMIALDSQDHEFLALPEGVKMPTQTATIAAPGSSKFKRGERVVFQPSDDDLQVDADEGLRIVSTQQIEASI
jgi:co-chaperonin GroES (HSP10)